MKTCWLFRVMILSNLSPYKDQEINVVAFSLTNDFFVERVFIIWKSTCCLVICGNFMELTMVLVEYAILSTFTTMVYGCVHVHVIPHRYALICLRCKFFKCLDTRSRVVATDGLTYCYCWLIGLFGSPFIM